MHQNEIPGSRREAKELGSTHYLTGKPCLKGHVALRFTSSGGCVSCSHISVTSEARLTYIQKYNQENRESLNAKSREYREKKPELRLKIEKAYRERNKEAVKERARQYVAENREKIRADGRARTAANKEKNRAKRKENAEQIRQKRKEYKAKKLYIYLAHEAKRRAHRYQVTPKWDYELTKFVVQEAFNLAKRRKALTGSPWHVDHLIPLRAKIATGLHTWSNIQVIPWRLNLEKNNRMVFTRHGEWIGST